MLPVPPNGQQARPPHARVSLLHLQMTHQRCRLQVDEEALGGVPVNGEAERQMVIKRRGKEAPPTSIQ